MIYDEELKRFHDWLRAKGEHPSVVLTLRWISEFEVYAEDDEEEFRELKVWAKQRSEYDRDAAEMLKVITEFEETEAPDPMLKRFHDWLQLKVVDPTAALARWWSGRRRVDGSHTSVASSFRRGRGRHTRRLDC